MKLSLTQPNALSLQRIIESASIAGALNVLRSRLLRLLGAEMQDFDKAKQSLAEEHAERGEDGKPVMIHDARGSSIKLKNNGRDFHLAYMALVNESPIVIQSTDDQTIQAFKLLRRILTTDLCPEIKGEDAARFGDIHEAVVAATATE